MPDIAIVAAPVTDRYGDLVTPGATTVLRRVKVWPRKSSETDENTLVVGISCKIPAGKRVPTAADTVLVDVQVDANGDPLAGTGRAYEVVGEPAQFFRSGNGPLKATVVDLERRS